MHNLIVRSGKDAAVQLLANKLVSLLRNPNTRDTASLYDLIPDIPYLAETLVQSFGWGQLDLDLPNYWLSSDRYIERMSPVQAQSIADKILVCIAILKRFPKGYSGVHGTELGQKMYRLASIRHPNETLRAEFGRLSLDFPAWVEILPNLPKEMSLVI